LILYNGISVLIKTRYIFGAHNLDHWAVTLSLIDGRFQSHNMAVLGYILP